MGKRKRDRVENFSPRDEDAFSHLAAMEPELRRLHGLMLVACILGKAQDQIEPGAISALAGCSVEIIERIQASWTLAFTTTASGPELDPNLR